MDIWPALQFFAGMSVSIKLCPSELQRDWAKWAVKIGPSPLI